MAADLTPEQLSSLAHWSAYGQPGSPPANRVEGTDWKTALSFQSPVTSPWHIQVQPDQLQKLIMGFQPQAMEDKWFVYAEGPSAEGKVVVRFYRSWTGSLIAELLLQLSEGEAGKGNGKGEKGAGEARVTGIVWEQNADVVRGQDEAGAKKGVREVCRWVLGVELQADEAS